MHVLGGVAALLGALLVGPRAGRFCPTVVGLPGYEYRATQPIYVVMGAFLLWTGWVSGVQ